MGVRAWVGAHHLPFGMSVRNLLRRQGFDEGRLGVMDLDSAWGHLLREAVVEEVESA